MNGWSNGNGAGGSQAKRGWSALRTSLKEGLQAPIDRLLQYSEDLVADAEERDAHKILGVLRNVREACRRSKQVVERILDTSQPPPDKKEAQHDLQGLISPIIQGCELLLLDAPELFLDSFVPDLEKMMELARYLHIRIDDLFHFVDSNGTVPPAQVEISGLPPLLSDTIAPPTEKGLLLVVDDNPIIRDGLCTLLKRQGHQTKEAANGRIALEMLRQHPFDLVLLDILMPELSGFDTLKQIKRDEKLRSIPVIMVSALDEIDSAVACIEHGAEDYLTKPCNTTLLRARIGACLEKKRLRDREVQHAKEIRELLQVILPPQVVQEWVNTRDILPRRVDNVAVLFADLAGFTQYCGQHLPEEVWARLQELILEWEKLALLHHVQKIKTLGDALMAACGLLEQPPDDPVLCAVRFGLDMIAATQRLAPDWSLRVGIHVGSVVAGVVGRRQFLFDLWGDTVNIASRMESHGQPNAVNLSPDAWARIATIAQGKDNPGEVKGIGWTKMVILESLTSPSEAPAPLATAAENV